MLGDTTAKFISYLKEHGPQTVKQLEELPFFAGVRSRIGVLVKQGRIERVSVANPFSSKNTRAVVVAYKSVDGAIEGALPRGRRVEETYRERELREKKARAVARAIILLEQQGYKVLPPNAVLSGKPPHSEI
jgi:hypothetical protein